MNRDTGLGLGVVALAVLCCAGPVVLSLLASGAVLSALGAFWAEARPWLLASGAILIAFGVWSLIRRSVQSRGSPTARMRPDRK